MNDILSHFGGIALGVVFILLIQWAWDRHQTRKFQSDLAEHARWLESAQAQANAQRGVDILNGCVCPPWQPFVTAEPPTPCPVHPERKTKETR